MNQCIMAKYPVIFINDPRLRAKTAEITDFNDELRTLVKDMIESMYAADGIGLAAPQIGISKKLAVIDVSEERNKPFCIINPVILEKEGLEEKYEGCLSVPGAYDKAPRALKVKVKAFDEHGKEFEINAEGLLAHCLQHEIDHLNGTVFIDYLSPLKRKLTQKKIEKAMKRIK